jgi:V8-like Glu-specific endopeptidase
MTVNTTIFPYDTVVRITDTIGNQDYQASGVLISPDEVLTASHVVYTAGVGTATNIVVTPGYEGSAPFGSAVGTTIHYNQIDDANDQITNYSSQYDFAVIHLSTSFTSIGTTMPLSPNFSGGLVTIAGYPASANGAMVASTQTVSVDPYYSLLDGVALGPGSSGGPVIAEGPSGPEVVGTVSTESEVSPAGYNMLITSAVLTQIEQWVADDNSATVTAPPVVENSAVTVTGTHTQYVIADNNGDLYYQDLATPGGAQTVPGVDEIVFSDGVGRFDPTGNAEEIARLYGVAFGRSADLSGLNYWTAAIDSCSLQLDNVSMAFVNSAEFQDRYGSLSNQNFVEQLYQNALGRTGDASGVAYWTGELNAGMSKGTVLVDFSDSFEYRQDSQATIGDKDMSEVYRLYQAAFDTTPDEGGWEYWTGVLDAGASPLQVAQSMAASAQFSLMFEGLSAAGKVNLLYENTFHQAGDAAGVNYWTGQLNAGVSMGQVLLGFSDSLENRIATAGATHDGWVYLAS